MVNADWHSHHLEVNMEEEMVLVDGMISKNFKCSIDNTGITLVIQEEIDELIWHWNVKNSIGKRFEPQITSDKGKSTIFIPHDFEKYPQRIFKATTYLRRSYVHGIGNVIELDGNN